MATTLSVAELRGLAKLHRAGVDGAAEQLADVVIRHGDELPELLGFPPSNLRRLREHTDPVEVLVTTIEAAPGVARDARGREQRHSATRIAAAVAESSRCVGDNIELDAVLLGAAVAAWPGAGDIVFGDRGVVDVRRLRSLLKECRRLPISMLLTPTTLNIKWATSRSRGNFKLWLRPEVTTSDNLVLPLYAKPISAAVIMSSAPRRSVPSAERSPEAVNVGPTAPQGSPVTEDPSWRPQDAPGAVATAPRLPETPSGIVEAPRRPAMNRPVAGSMALRFINAISAVMGTS